MIDQEQKQINDIYSTETTYFKDMSKMIGAKEMYDNMNNLRSNMNIGYQFNPQTHALCKETLNEFDIIRRHLTTAKFDHILQCDAMCNVTLSVPYVYIYIFCNFDINFI